MCGIIGVVSNKNEIRAELLLAGRDAMIHRGPDDAGIWFSADRTVALGHRRLSIVDLSPSGHQPMQDAAGQLTIVFNGEIYNFVDLKKELEGRGHRFRSRSDTEVVLACYREWGIECLRFLNGMFALAIFDTAEKKLFLARDRAGEKPLFYIHSNSSLRFASEIKGLFADPSIDRRINPMALDAYLTMGYVPGEMCIVEGLNKLPPAHAMLFDIERNECRVWRYWSLPSPPDGQSGEESPVLEAELEALLEDAVRRQLIADVPVGVLLSGGVDSSLITALSVRGSARVKTYSVGFPGYARHDETAHARLIAKYFGTDHTELEAGDVSPDLLSVLASQFDEPMADSSMIPTFLVTQLVRRHCTVALGGDGGDELFGGYLHYSRLLWTRDRIAKVPLSLRRIAASGARLLPSGFRGRNWLRSLRTNFANELPHIANFFDQNERRRLVASDAGTKLPLTAENVWRERTPKTEDLLQRATRMEFENYMPEDILVKVDRASMLNSLEVRAPFLDYRIIEFAFGRVPSSLKANAAERKKILKRLAAKLLPPQFDRQRKQGFSIPLAEWLRGGPWRDLFCEVLFNSNSLFDRRAVGNLLRGQDSNRNNQERLFSLVLFELWRRAYGMAL
jgi:asparagine synthase (glutamine-hydrolysing)